MSVDSEPLVKAGEELYKIMPKRNFKQSIEIAINLRDVDLRRPENRIRATVTLPNPIEGRNVKVCVVAERQLALKAKEAGADLVIGRDDLERIAGDKRALKKLAKEYDFFLVQPDLIPVVGRLLGKYLGPRGKAPQPLPPNVDVKYMIERARRSVNIRTKTQPVVHAIIGKEGMDPKKVAENALAVISALETKYKIPQNIKSIYVKATMSPAVKVEFTGKRRRR